MQSKAWTFNPDSGLYSGNQRRNQARKRLVQLLSAFLKNVRGMPVEQRLDAPGKKLVFMKSAKVEEPKQDAPSIDDIQCRLEEMDVVCYQLKQCREEKEVLRHQLAELKGNVSMLNDLLDEKDRVIREKDIIISDQTKRMEEQTERIHYLVDQMMDKRQEPLCSQQYHDSETTYTGPSSSVKSNINDLVWGQPSNMHW